MLEKLPHGLGHLLKGARAGLEKIVFLDAAFGETPETLVLHSAAFGSGAAIPVRFTEDGAKLSPPLDWTDVPQGAAALVLIVEDPDAPTPSPFVHLIVTDLAPADGELAEGALHGPATTEGRQGLGRNTMGKAQYLPPDPPPGHGPHRYCFQLFAVDRPLDLGEAPDRGAVVKALRDHAVARAILIGTYERP